MPFCSKCGTQNQDNASACTSCGNSLSQAPNILDSGSSGDGFLDKIRDYINDLMLFFDKGEFFKISWRWMYYHLPAIVYALLPIALIGVAINFKVFDMPAKVVIVLFIAFIFLTIASFLSVLGIQNRTKDFDEQTKDFSTNKVTLSNFYDFFKVAFVHSIETNVYVLGIFMAITVFGLAFCSLFMDIIREKAGQYILFGFIAGPAYAYVNIFFTKILVLFLKVLLEYLPKLIIIPIRALYNLFGIVIDTRHNLWK